MKYSLCVNRMLPAPGERSLCDSMGLETSPDVMLRHSHNTRLVEASCRLRKHNRAAVAGPGWAELGVSSHTLCCSEALH